MQTDMQTVTLLAIALADGRRFVVSNEQVSITDCDGSVVATITLTDISAVRRGGWDIIVTRRQTDPVVVTATTIADAQQVLTILGQHIAQPSASRWWRRQP